MAVIYERWHSPYACCRIHDDCLPRTEEERRARQREVQAAAARAVQQLVEMCGEEKAAQLLKESPYNPDNYTERQQRLCEQVAKIREDWWEWRLNRDIQDAKEAGRIPRDWQPDWGPLPEHIPEEWEPPVVLAYEAGGPTLSPCGAAPSQGKEPLGKA